MTTTTFVPVAAPEDVAVATEEFEDVTVVLDRAPDRLLSASASLLSVVASVWIWVNAESWLDTVVSCDSHTSSGASAAVTAAFTAAVTSMPGVDAPVAASRISLRSMESAAEEDEDRSEFSAEVELMNFSFARRSIPFPLSALEEF